MGDLGGDECHGAAQHIEQRRVVVAAALIDELIDGDAAVRLQRERGLVVEGDAERAVGARLQRIALEDRILQRERAGGAVARDRSAALQTRDAADRRVRSAPPLAQPASRLEPALGSLEAPRRFAPARRCSNRGRCPKSAPSSASSMRGWTTRIWGRPFAVLSLSLKLSSRRSCDPSCIVGSDSGDTWTFPLGPFHHSTA
jgi:hypothetical protein